MTQVAVTLNRLGILIGLLAALGLTEFGLPGKRLEPIGLTVLAVEETSQEEDARLKTNIATEAERSARAGVGRRFVAVMALGFLLQFVSTLRFVAVGRRRHEPNTAPESAEEGPLNPLLTTALPRLRHLLDVVQAHLQRIEVRTNDRKELLTVALAVRIQELAEASYLLLKADNDAGAFEVTRTALEALADLTALREVQGYEYNMRATDLDHRVNLWELAISAKNKNRYLGLLGSAGREELIAMRAELKELKERGFEPLAVHQRFKKASLSELYDGPYADLSSHSHTNASVLTSRHIRDIDGSLHVVAFSGIGEVEGQLLVDTAAGLVANAVAAVEAVQGRGSENLAAVTQALNDVRGLWKGGPQAEAPRPVGLA